jgi:hypothetical protein
MKARGWSVNVEAELRRRKEKLSKEYDRLDVLSESRNLNDNERERMKNIYSELNKI